MNVVACVVSVKSNSISEGRLQHSELGSIWSEFEPALYEWMLKLCEEFDLIARVADKEVSLVPCLLPECEPVGKEMHEWTTSIEAHAATMTIKEFKVTYTFEYLPAGLFNRFQVRLFQYCDDESLIWKHGFLLTKNAHRALVQHLVEELTIEIRVRGTKPANIVFVIHEVLESLINDSYKGIQYDYSFPCAVCVDTAASDPSMFSSSTLLRALQMRAPFLQCSKAFHVVSLQEMFAIMPVGGGSGGGANLDLHLAYSLGDLKRLRKQLKYDIFFWYCADDCSSSSTSSKTPKERDQDNARLIDPLAVIESLQAQTKYTVWYTRSPREQKFELITQSIKQAKLVVIAISDQFDKDEQSIRVICQIVAPFQSNLFELVIIIIGRQGEVILTYFSFFNHIFVF